MLQAHVHRDLRIAIDGVGIETPETFAIDWAKVKNDRIFDNDGKRVEQYYGFGEDVLAVADGIVVSIHDGMPDEPPLVFMVPRSKSDYGGNNVILEIAPNVFAWYAHLRQGSLTVKVGDAVKAGAPIAKLGNTGPSEGPHLQFGSCRQARLYRRTEPAFRLRQLHLGRRGRFRRLKGGSTGDSAGCAAGSVRLSALRRHPEFSVSATSDYAAPTPAPRGVMK